MGTLRWSDADEIAFLLYEAHPQLDPLTVRFTDLHRYVTQLPDFADDATASTESALEAIQMAWLAYYQEDR